MLKKLFLSFALALIFAFSSFAQTTIKARVVGIVDGDTLTVLDKEFRQITVRLAGIDAPEKKQDFGSAAKEYLAKLIFERKVIVVSEKKDRYGRTIGKILLDGKDINLLMVEAGFAWHYKEYEDEQTKEDRESYADAEKIARKAVRGLWQQANAVKPSEFRKAEKSETIAAPTLTPGGRTPLNVLITQTQPENPATPAVSGNTGATGANTSAPGNPPTAEKTVQVKGYTRRDGTYVPPHTRSAPRKKN